MHQYHQLQPCSVDRITAHVDAQTSASPKIETGVVLRIRTRVANEQTGVNAWVRGLIEDLRKTNVIAQSDDSDTFLGEIRRVRVNDNALADPQLWVP